MTGAAASFGICEAISSGTVQGNELSAAINNIGIVDDSYRNAGLPLGQNQANGD